MKFFATILSLATFTSLVAANCKTCPGNTGACVDDTGHCSNDGRNMKGGFLFYRICCDNPSYPSVSCWSTWYVLERSRKSKLWDGRADIEEAVERQFVRPSSSRDCCRFGDHEMAWVVAKIPSQVLSRGPGRRQEIETSHMLKTASRACIEDGYSQSLCKQGSFMLSWNLGRPSMPAW